MKDIENNAEEAAKSKKDNRNRIILAIFSVYFVITLIFMSVVLYNSVVEANYDRGAEDGQEAIINTLIQESQTCNPIPIFNGDNRADLINIECLASPEENSQENTGEDNAQPNNN